MTKEINVIDHLQKFNYLLFTDASTSPTRKISVGAFLYFQSDKLHELMRYSNEKLFIELSNMVNYKEYQSKKSTWTEIKTAIDALSLLTKNLTPATKVAIYTDCQSIIDLTGERREKLKKNNFLNKSGNILHNSELYKELFFFTEKYKIQSFKIKGHRPASSSMAIQEKIFTILDKLSRKKLRSFLNNDFIPK